MSNTGTTYGHDQWKYYVKQREDNGKFTVYLSDGRDLESTVATIPDFDTFEEAQNALDGYALKHKFAAECSTPGEEPKWNRRLSATYRQKTTIPFHPRMIPRKWNRTTIFGTEWRESGTNGIPHGRKPAFQ